MIDIQTEENPFPVFDYHSKYVFDYQNFTDHLPSTPEKTTLAKLSPGNSSDRDSFTEASTPTTRASYCSDSSICLDFSDPSIFEIE